MWSAHTVIGLPLVKKLYPWSSGYASSSGSSSPPDTGCGEKKTCTDLGIPSNWCEYPNHLRSLLSWLLAIQLAPPL